jgi:hypothetical protein
MIISFTTVFAIAAGTLLGAGLLAAAALLVAHAAIRQARAAGSSAALSAQRLAEIEVALNEVTGQLRTLLAENERAAAAPTRPSLREAVALSRHGASTEELVATCRIGQSEARLIQMLYGAARPAADPGRSSEVH